MPPLRSRHERFCRGFVECANASAAARLAGYKPEHARNAGYRLLKEPRIIERIAELYAQRARDQSGHRDVLIGKLETVYQRAIDDHNFSAAARAVELQARLAGMISTRPTAASTKKTGAEDAASAGAEPQETVPEKRASGES